jgi:hypothetical protein
VTFQAKTVFGSWSPTTGRGDSSQANILHRGGDASGKPDRRPLCFVPVTSSLRDDRVFVHANLGWSREKESRQDQMTWASLPKIRSTRKWA